VILHPKCERCPYCQPSGAPDVFCCVADIELECIGYNDIYVEVDW